MTGEVQGPGDIAVTPHVLATQAAMEMYVRGGNAVDAAIAANAVQGAVAPETCGIGGDLFALIHLPGVDRPEALNASGPAGSNADPDELRRAGHDTIPPFHPLTVTIPGCVAGWEALVDRFGNLSLGEVLEPAIRLANEGFPASSELCRAFSARAETLVLDPSAREMYPDGWPPQRGALIRRPAHARTLAGIATGGADWFYGDEPGRAIAEAVEGRITRDDLVAFRPEWVEPLRIDLWGMTGWTVPPNSQGYLVLATLGVFDLLDPPSDPTDPAWVHLIIEAYRAVAWDREGCAADPASSGTDPADLLERSRLAERAGGISPDSVARWSPSRSAPGGTAYLATLDRQGMGVSLIQSNYWGIGSGIGAGEAGFMLHNRGAGFNLEPGHPNQLAPGKRPLHTLSPTLWTGDQQLLLLGTRGGDQQPQILAPQAARLLRHGWTPGQVQQVPRWTLEQFGPGAESTVRLEASTPPAVIEGLEQRGHRVEVMESSMPGWGPVSIIQVDEQGMRTAAADPRIDTAAAAAR